MIKSDCKRINTTQTLWLCSLVVWSWLCSWFYLNIQCLVSQTCCTSAHPPVVCYDRFTYVYCIIFFIRMRWKDMHRWFGRGIGLIAPPPQLERHQLEWYNQPNPYTSLIYRCCIILRPYEFEVNENERWALIYYVLSADPMSNILE